MGHALTRINFAFVKFCLWLSLFKMLCCSYSFLPSYILRIMNYKSLAGAWQALYKAEVEIPPEKFPTPSREVKFLGTWCIAGSAAILLDILCKTEQLQMPQSWKELKQLMGALGYWRKHIPGFSVIVYPLYSLSQERKPWKWKPEQ